MTHPALDALAAPATINDICEACNGCGLDNPAIATSPCRICGGSGQRPLKLCPFCGGRAEHVTGPMFHGAPRSAQVYMRYVMCLRCNNSTAMTDTREQAAALWNARSALRNEGSLYMFSEGAFWPCTNPADQPAGEPDAFVSSDNGAAWLAAFVIDRMGGTDDLPAWVRRSAKYWTDAQAEIKRLRAAPAAPPRAFWVVEQWKDGRSIGYWDGGSSRSFVSDIDKAVHFCRHDDAFWATRGWHWTDTKICEHMYLADQPAPLHAAQQHKRDCASVEESWQACDCGADQPAGEPDARIIADLLIALKICTNRLIYPQSGSIESAVSAADIAIAKAEGRAAPAAPPREPTQAMLDAGHSAEYGASTHRTAGLVWRAMYDAASAPAGSEDGGTGK